MEKELKSCMGVLLRADLTRQKLADWLNWLCPVRSALKRTPVQDFDSSVLGGLVFQGASVFETRLLLGLFLWLIEQIFCNFRSEVDT